MEKKSKNIGLKEKATRRLETAKFRRKDVTKNFHEAGPQIKERKASWQKKSKDRLKREEELQQQTAELASATRMDKEMKTESLHCYNDWVKFCDEADDIHERKKFAGGRTEGVFLKARAILGAKVTRKRTRAFS